MKNQTAGNLFSWLRDDVFRKMIKNTGILLSSSVLSSLLRVLSMIVAARILGPKDFGILILIQTYVGLIDRLVNFQCWQAVIKFGSNALEQKNIDYFKTVLKCTILLEIGTAFLGAFLAFAGAHWVGTFYQWDASIVQMIMIYSCVILFNITGSSIGILRLFDKFKLLAWQRVLSASFKLIGILYAAFNGFGILGFMVIWMSTTIVEYLLHIYFALSVLREKGIGKIANADLENMKGEKKKLFRFVLFTNLNSSVRLISKEFDIMVVGSILGAAAAGLYKIAKQFSFILSRLIDPLYESIYPELAKLWSANNIKKFTQLIFRSSMLSGALAIGTWVFVILFGKYIIAFTVGGNFAETYQVLVFYMLSVVIAVAGLPLQPAMLAMGKPQMTFLVNIIATVLYLVILFPLTRNIGLVGSAISMIVYYGLWTFLMILIETVMLRKHRALTDGKIWI